VSQGWISQAERGRGAMGSLETWSALAAGVGMQLAAFIELAAGATPPRDHDHLRRQQAVVTFAAPGGWRGRPEVTVITADGVQRFADVVLDRDPTNETVVVEVVDLFADVGEDLRGLERKVEAIRRLRPGRRVAGLLVVRATKRNRALVQEFRALFRSRFTSGSPWIRALRGTDPLPTGDGILWSGAVEPTISSVNLGRDQPAADHQELSRAGFSIVDGPPATEIRPSIAPGDRRA
jgi:hypothetical protein